MAFLLPPLNLNLNSSSEARASSGGSNGFDASGWTVSTGSSSAGAAMPWYVLAGAALLALVAIKKMGSR